MPSGARPWTLVCEVSWPRNLNARPQKQTCAFSPVWIETCAFSSALLLNLYPHRTHSNLLSLSCIFLCILRAGLVLKLFPQVSQTKLLTAECDRKWSCKWLFLEKALSHTSQMKGFSWKCKARVCLDRLVPSLNPAPHSSQRYFLSPQCVLTCLRHEREAMLLLHIAHERYFFPFSMKTLGGGNSISISTFLSVTLLSANSRERSLIFTSSSSDLMLCKILKKDD